VTEHADLSFQDDIVHEHSLIAAERFYSSGGSYVALARKFGAGFAAGTAPSRGNIYQSVKH
jgi:hypothetical protein